VLNDRERRALQDIQRHLTSEDPGLQRRLESPAQIRFSRPPNMSRRAYTILFALTCMFMMVCLAAGSLLATAVLGGLAVLLWEGRRHSDDAPPEA
jgi:hypothetical protein